MHIRSYLNQLDIAEVDEVLSAVEPLGVAAIAVLNAPPGRIANILTPNGLDAAVRNYEGFAAGGFGVQTGHTNYRDRWGSVECFWPGATRRRSEAEGTATLRRSSPGRPSAWPTGTAHATTPA